MSSYIILSFIGGLVFVGIGFAVACIVSEPQDKYKNPKKVIAHYITASISLIIGATLIICALVAIDKNQTQTCTGCGGVVRNTNYCTNCGTPAQKAKFEYVCKYCHKTINTNYCGDCGGEKVQYIPNEVTATDLTD